MRARTPMVLLQSANLLAGTANALLMLTIPWLILERTDSPLAAGVAGALTGLPGIFLAPIAGRLVDRLGRRTVSVASDLLRAVSVALFPIAAALGILELWVIFALTLLGAAFDPAGYTARKALIPDTARASGMSMADANGLHEGIFMAGWVLGPVLGAAAIATVGALPAMWFGCAAFLLAAGAISIMKVSNKVATGPSGDDGAPATPGEQASGLRLLMRDRAVWALTLVVALLLMIYMPTEAVLLPVHFEALEQPGGMGLVISAMAAGAMIGAFGYGRISPHFTRRKLALLCISGASLAYVPMAFLPPVWLFLFAGFLLGLAWGPLEPLVNTLVQTRFPAAQHGRIYGIQLSLFYAAPPLGELVAGASVAALGVQPVFVGIALILICTAIAITAVPALRELDADFPEKDVAA